MCQLQSRGARRPQAVLTLERITDAEERAAAVDSLSYMLAGDEGRIAFARVRPQAFFTGGGAAAQAPAILAASGAATHPSLRAWQEQALFLGLSLEGQQFDGDALADIVAKVMEGLAKGDKELAAEARQAAGPWRVERPTCVTRLWRASRPPGTVTRRRARPRSAPISRRRRGGMRTTRRQWLAS